MKTSIIIGVLTLLLLAACSGSEIGDPIDDTELEEQLISEILTPAEQERGIRVTDEGVKYLVDPSKVIGGGPPKDGIPSIDNPKFESVEEADEWLSDGEDVLGFIYKGEKRVYPLQVMVWHEIVNDFVGEDPVLITYCPLCGSGIAYERVIDGEAVEFGTSGKLYNSNLVMYDRKTDTYWAQIGGNAIIGELTGMQLTALSVDTVTWGEWKTAHPESKVLSKDTGILRPYGQDPYGDYYTNERLIAPVENSDSTVHPKTVIFGIEINGAFKAYKEADLLEGSIEDTFNGVNLLVERLDGGVVKITNTDTGEEIVKERDFYFAWYAFHPDTELYER